MSWGVKTTCCKAPGVSLGGSGVSIGGVRSLREAYISYILLYDTQLFYSPGNSTYPKVMASKLPEICLLNIRLVLI